MNLKQQAAWQAMDYLHNDMVIGLGTGSTVSFLITALGEAISSGRLQNIKAVPTSKATAQQAQEAGIPLSTLSANPVLDLAIDGADEIDPALNLIKGLGKALLREKLVEIHARQFYIIADESKLVDRLGRGPLPVEIVSFEAPAHVQWLASLGCRAELWCDEKGAPYLTDNGNYLARCWFNGIDDPYHLAHTLAEQPGIVEHGLFLDMASRAIIAHPSGIQIMERNA